MANLKEIRIRLNSVKSTKQITSAMKMVSAAKLRKAQDKIVRLRPYASKLHEILVGLSQSLAERNYLYNDLTFENVSVVADEVMNSFIAGEFDRVELIYNQFKNAAVQN